MMEAAQAELLHALSRLYQSGKYSDLTVICHSVRYKVHKALLCSRSRFFDTACSSAFLESKNGEINLSQEDAEVVAHMIDYFYYLDYDMDNESDCTAPTSPYQASTTAAKAQITDPLLASATASTLSPPLSRSSSPSTRQPIVQPLPNLARSPKPLSRRQLHLRRRPRESSSSSSAQDAHLPLTPSSRGTEASDADDIDLSDEEGSADEDEAQTPRLLLHAKLYSAGEKYGIPGLKMLSKSKFERRLFPGSLEDFNLSALRNDESREVFLSDELPAAIEEIYTGTVDADRGLRNAIVQAFRAHPEWGRRGEIADVIREHGTLGYDLYRATNGIPIR